MWLVSLAQAIARSYVLILAMGANPPKRDAWPLPERVRHVWVDPGHPTRMSYQGLVPIPAGARRMDRVGRLSR